MNIQNFNTFKELEKKLERKKSEPEYMNKMSKTDSLKIITNNSDPMIKSPRMGITTSNQSTLLQKFYKGIKEENFSG